MAALSLVSIILPVYNGMPYLKDSVQSIFDQSFKDWELVVVNDGSTDGSAEYLRALANQDRRVHYVEHSSNRGIAAAYNTGIRRARGRYLAFQEQDDVSVSERLEKQLDQLSSHSVLFASSQVAWIDGNGSIYAYWPNDISDAIEISQPTDDQFAQLLIYQTRIANTTTFIDHYGIDEADLLFDERFRTSGQDWDWHLRLARRYPILRSREPLVHMRRYVGHRSSTSRRLQVFQDNRCLLAKHFRIEMARLNRWRTLRVFAKAWSNEFVIEARYRRSLYGVVLGLLALVLWPLNPEIWTSIKNLRRHVYQRVQLGAR